MIIGFIMIVTGSILAFKNKQIALRIRHERAWGFADSVARQNIAIIGVLLILSGVGLVGLFLFAF